MKLDFLGQASTFPSENAICNPLSSKAEMEIKFRLIPGTKRISQSCKEIPESRFKEVVPEPLGHFGNLWHSEHTYHI